MDRHDELMKAIQSLNLKPLQSNARLTVKWVFENAEKVQQALDEEDVMSKQYRDSQINSKCTSMSKYTCKYEVQIPSDSKF